MPMGILVEVAWVPIANAERVPVGRVLPARVVKHVFYPLVPHSESHCYVPSLIYATVLPAPDSALSAERYRLQV